MLWHLGKIDRRYKSARGGRGPSSLKPLIVVCRQVQQSSLGKLVCVLSKAATALGMRFQEVRIHHVPHSTTNSPQRAGAYHQKSHLVPLSAALPRR